MSRRLPRTTRPARRHRSPGALLACALTIGSLGLIGSADAQKSSAPTTVTQVTQVTQAAKPRPTRAFRPARGLFGPTSEWRRKVRSAPLAENSAGLVANLANQVAIRYDGVAAFNFYEYHVSFYTVRPGRVRRDIVWDNCQSKPYLPGQLFDPARGAHFTKVPIPARAIPAAGSDGELSIYDPATDQLWELWKAVKLSDGWHACWGGRIDNVSTSPGYFSDGMGVAATGLSVSGGAIGIREMQAGVIDHAMSLNVVDAAHWSEYSYPAQRSDGSAPAGTPDAIMEGQRFRLDPKVDVDALDLTPIARAIAVAAQKYGFIVNDKGGAVAVVAESAAGIAAKRGSDPWGKLLEGSPGYRVMEDFPWSKLQALPEDYGKS